MTNFLNKIINSLAIGSSDHWGLDPNNKDIPTLKTVFVPDGGYPLTEVHAWIHGGKAMIEIVNPDSDPFSMKHAMRTNNAIALDGVRIRLMRHDIPEEDIDMPR